MSVQREQTGSSVDFSSDYFATCTKAQIPLRQLLPKLSHGESRGHKSWKLQTQTVTNH